MNREDYPSAKADAVFAELGDVLAALGEYADCVFVVGGWVPYLATFERRPPVPHSRSLDIDLLIDPDAVPGDAYATIRALLERRGFRPDPAIPHRMIKPVPVADDSKFRVALDLLAPEQAGGGKARRHRRIQQALARKAHGGDLVPSPFEVKDVSFDLPGRGGRKRIRVRFASPLSFLVMKAAALRDRRNEKDAYDVAYLVEHHPDGIERLRDGIRSVGNEPLVREMIATLREAFASPDAHGTASAVRFEGFADPDETDRRRRRVFELIRALLEGL